MRNPADSKPALLLNIAAIVVPLLLLVVLAGFARNTVGSLEKTHALVDRTFSLKRDLAQLLRTVVDAETAQRGYVLAQKEQFLEPYTEALACIPELQGRIENTILDATAHDLFRQVKAAIAERMKFTTSAVEMQQRGEHDKVVAMISSGQGKTLMDQVRAKFDALEQRQDYLLGIRQEQHRKSASMNEYATWLLIGLDLAVVGLVIYLFAYLRRAQALLRVCAWSQTVEYQGEWLTYDEYLRRRFGLTITHGISPLEAEKLLRQAKKA